MTRDSNKSDASKEESNEEEPQEPEELDEDVAHMTFYFDAEGFMTFPDGSRYKGDLDKGIPQGNGMLIYTDGSTYNGEWH